MAHAGTSGLDAGLVAGADEVEVAAVDGAHIAQHDDAYLAILDETGECPALGVGHACCGPPPAGPRSPPSAPGPRRSRSCQ